MTTPKVRIHEIAKVLGVPNADVIDALAKEFNTQAKSHSSTVEKTIADKVVAYFKNGRKSVEDKPAEPKRPEVRVIKSSSPDAPRTIVGRPAARKPKPEPEPEPEKVEKVEASAEAPTQPEAPAAAKAEPASEPEKVQKPAAESKPEAPKAPEQPAAKAEQKSEPEPKQPEQPAASAEDSRRPGPPKPQAPVGRTVPTRFAAPSPAPRSTKPKGGKASRIQRRQAEIAKQVAARKQKEEEQAALDATPKVTTIDEAITVRDLAIKLRLRDTELIKHLFMKGMMVTVNQTLEVDFAKTVAQEFEFEVQEREVVKHEGEYAHLEAGKAKLSEEKYKNLKSRAPVVSIMGHVDHGKTTLLDAIRETRHKIVDTEAGGITQSIGAYTVEKNDQRIVFLDTPGHEAFTAMRMRGAQATDIAILVVAADDGVMPQTIEALNHAKAAQIPIIVAVNKIDKEDADPDRVLVQLADYGLSAEKWGGDTLTVEVSALQKLGLDDVLDAILLVSEILDPKADTTVAGEGVIVEAQLDKRMGPVATALVQNGTLRVGDNVLIGSVGGRVRALIDDHGQRIQEAGPATPVEILGLNGVPNAGESFHVIANDKEFKQLLSAEKLRERETRLTAKAAMAAGFSGRMETGDEKTRESQFNLLIKADTQGSLEAVLDVLQRMGTEEVKLNIIHSATGDISEADIMLASTAGALMIGFNTKEDVNAARLAEQQGVIVKTYDIIYRMTEDVERWLLGQLEPETEEVEAGSAEVRQIFTVGKSAVIAGCMVTSGKMIRNAKAVVMRNGKPVHTGPMDNLKRFRDDAKEVAQGYECGISFERFNDLQEGDIITVYTVKEMERTSL